MNLILENLSIGSYCDACNPPDNIDVLLCVARELEIGELKRVCHKVPIEDMKPIPPRQLREAVKWIHNKILENRILVFCNAGIGRSPSVVVAYLCCERGYRFGDAVEFVATKKPYMSILPCLIETIEQLKKEGQNGKNLINDAGIG